MLRRLSRCVECGALYELRDDESIPIAGGTVECDDAGKCVDLADALDVALEVFQRRIARTKKLAAAHFAGRRETMAGRQLSEARAESALLQAELEDDAAWEAFKEALASE